VGRVDIWRNWVDPCLMISQFLRKFALKVDEKFATRAPVFISSLIERIIQQKRISYSSFGEDLIVESLFKPHEFKTKEVLEFNYVDVGAWRPIRGSNTFKFYKKGIYGTVVEPNANLVNIWRSIRPKDQFLQVACSVQKELHFYQFTRLAPSNTGNKVFAEEISVGQNIEVIQTSKVKGLSLDEIIEMHLRRFKGKFVLDLDIEGDDLSVLKNFSFVGSRRPMVLLVEDHFKADLILSPIHNLLLSKNYALFGRTTITSIYIDKESSLSNSLYPIQ
jgi:hypothetical protein